MTGRPCHTSTLATSPSAPALYHFAQPPVVKLTVPTPACVSIVFQLNRIRFSWAAKSPT